MKTLPAPSGPATGTAAQARRAPRGVPGTWRLAAGPYAVLIPRKPLLGTVAVLVVLIAASGVHLAVGEIFVHPLDALRALAGEGTPRDILVVERLRLPRLQAGLAVGAALGAAGCLMQTLAQNRLATPDTVGLNDGATAFAVASVTGISTSLLPSAAALTGAATAAALTLALSGGAGRGGYRFLVVGLGVGAVFGAVTGLVLARSAADSANAAYGWTVGTLNGRDQEAVSLLAVALLLALPLAMVLGRRLLLLRLSDSVALGLGVRVKALRLAVIAVAVVLGGLAVAVAGPLGMIALAAPEAARRVAGPRSVPVLLSALAGALFTLLADLVGRTVLAPLEVPVGLVTAVVGGPYLIWLLLTTRTRRSL
ncbi:iron ABC transporter permease [Streptomyces sp. NPDC050388]|uniref:FecCD family ABC transporter permease n=1 Tax=Streptomyces sp. NPDC050388 TaxID=3155781 RepID=UPI00341F36B5